MLKSFVASNQSYTYPFLGNSKGHIYITYFRIWMVEVLLEIIQYLLFLFLNSKLIIECIDCLKREQRHFTLIVHTKRYHQHVHLA